MALKCVQNSERDRKSNVYVYALCGRERNHQFIFHGGGGLFTATHRQPAIHTYIIIVLICVLIFDSVLVLRPFTTYLLVEQN